MMKSFCRYIVMLLLVTSLSAQTYDFNEFIELVKKNNKELMIAAKDMEMAKAQEREAKSSIFPQLSLEGKYNRNLNEGYMYANLGGLVPGGGGGTQKFKVTYENEFDVQAVLRQQLFNSTVFNAIKAADQYEKLSGYSYDATFQGIIAGSKKAFYQTMLLKKVWEVEKASLENAKENYDNTSNKYDNGLVSQLELLQAKVNWENQVPVVSKAERNYQLALNSLKILAGIPVENEFHIEGEIETEKNDAGELNLPDVLNRRPDYNALLWQKKLMETNIDVEFSGHMPSLYASLVYNYNSKSDEFEFDNENNYLIAGLTLQVPIFDGWNTSAKVQQAEIELDQAEIEIEKTKEEIKKEIRNASLRIAEAKKRTEAAQQTLETAKKGYEITEVTAEGGLATQLELKDARLNYDQARLNYYSAMYDYLEAYFDWQLAAGLIETPEIE